MQFSQRWSIHDCLDEAYVPFFGALPAAWDDAMVARWSANSLGMLRSGLLQDHLHVCHHCKGDLAEDGRQTDAAQGCRTELPPLRISSISAAACSWAAPSASSGTALR
jgi:hypothetical protein